MNLIVTKNLTKTYVTGQNIKTEALRGVDITINKKDFVAIAGPSGSGKSSLLNLLGALDNPTDGTIEYEGKNISQFKAAELSNFRLHKIGFVFQSYNLISTLTAIENVEFLMLLQGVPSHVRKERSVDILTRVGLENYIHSFPQQMSGGQQQRVAVARAIVSQPSVILADEPTANLDSKTAESLLDLMLELNQERSITFIFSTHDPMIMNKVKTLLTLKDGVLIN